MLPYQISTWERVKLIISIATFGLLAPALIDFREEIKVSDDEDEQNRKPQMTVNNTETEEIKENPQAVRR